MTMISAVLLMLMSAALAVAQTPVCGETPAVANNADNLIICSGSGIQIEDAQNGFRRIDLLQIARNYASTVERLSVVEQAFQTSETTLLARLSTAEMMISVLNATVHEQASIIATQANTIEVQQTRLINVEQKLQISETAISALNSSIKEQADTITIQQTSISALALKQNLTSISVINQHENLSNIVTALNASLVGQTSSLQSQLDLSAVNLTSLSIGVAELQPRVTVLEDVAKNIEWVELIGGSGSEESYNIAADTAGNVFMSGWTVSPSVSGGNVSMGEADMIVAKFSRYGTLDWMQLLGGSDKDESGGITTDKKGNVYITGRTKSASLPGSNTNEGGAWDIVVAKFSGNGTRRWVKLLGGSGSDEGRGIATDTAGFVYITGCTTSPSLPGSNTNVGGGLDMFVAKFSDNGTRLWVQLLGGSGEECGDDIVIDTAGMVCITGWTTSPSLPGSNDNSAAYDIVVARFSSEGARQWVQLLGNSASDYGQGIATDSSGNLFITGFTNSASLSGSNANAGGAWDIVVVKFSSNGTRLWVKLLGGTGADEAFGIAADSTGQIYITGRTNSPSLSGNTNAGSNDIVLAMFSNDGTLLKVQLLGGPRDDYGYGIAVDATGLVYISGYTQTSLPGSNAHTGGNDIVVAKFK